MENVILLIIGLMALALIVKRVSRNAAGSCHDGCAGTCECQNESCSKET